MSPKLSRDFYLRSDTLRVARDLLGKLIVVPDDKGHRVSGMIVETEAYLGEIDRSAHSYNGRRTPRNEVTYGVGGYAYVFFIYGMYYQLNVVCGEIDTPHVVLIRAVEPVEGIEIMRLRRRPKSEPGAAALALAATLQPEPTGFMPDKNLTSGPGKLCIALDINRDFNGEDLLEDRIWLEDHQIFKKSQIAVGTRIGIDYAGEDANLPLRFWVKGNEFVSKK